MDAEVGMDALDEMLDRLTREGPIGLTPAGRVFGTFRSGAVTTPPTVARWCSKGILLPNGRRVFLEHFRIGARLMTSREACLRFLKAQNTPAEVPTCAPPRSPAKRQAASERARRELDAATA